MEDINASGIAALQDAVSKVLVATTRTAGQLSAEDLGFHRTMDPLMGVALDRTTKRLFKLSKALIKTSQVSSVDDALSLQDADDVETNWRAMVDGIDSLLERADTCLDEYTGLIKKNKLEPQMFNEKIASIKTQKPRLSVALRTQNIAKPQWLFRTPVNNHDDSPFKPLLKSKPHAIVPLKESWRTFIQDGNEVYQNPYEPEIEQFQYPASVFEFAEPIPYHPFDTTSAIFVDTPEKLNEMLTELRKVKEIAIDLEHHDTRSYVGILSLMQISTRDQDWIVDTLKPWREDLQVLNEVFADPTILKVMQGASMDILWLQRDLGLYVVGLFDTYHACRALNYPQRSLAYLFTRFLDIQADKQYQMADWRVRPLPLELFNYARSDTHYLLYIYDHLRNELAQISTSSSGRGEAIENVLSRSKEESLQIYTRFKYDEETGQGRMGWSKFMRTVPTDFNPQQISVARAIHQWRDKVARQTDDSLFYTMPSHVILSIARSMPTDLASLLGAASRISESVRTRTTELLSVISKAKVAGLDGPSLASLLQANDRPMRLNLPIEREATERPKRQNLREFMEQNEQAQSSTLDVPGSNVPAATSYDSRLWGSALQEPAQSQQQNATLRRSLIGLALPLPLLTADSITDETDGARHIVEVPNDGPPPADEMIERRDEGDLIVLEQSKRSAKRNLTRRKRKSQCRAEKKRGLAETGDQGKWTDDGQGNDGNQTPFDYSRADSVLHAKREATGANLGFKKAFDPYSKSGDAPKGMRRAQKETPGKSVTFKD